jgi:hypothetical protein
MSFNLAKEFSYSLDGSLHQDSLKPQVVDETRTEEDWILWGDCLLIMKA